MTRRRFAGRLAAALAVLVAFSVRPSSAVTVDLPFRVEVGQRSAVTIVKERETYSAGTLQRQGRSTTPVSVRVVDRIPDGWVYRWTFGEPTVEDPAQAANPLVRKMADMVDGLQLEFETTVTGLPTRVRNTAAIRRHMGDYAANLVSGIMAQASGEGATAAELDALKQRLDRMTSLYLRMSDEQVSQAFMKEPTLLNLVSGDAHSSEQATETPGELSNPLGGPPIRAVSSTRLRELDAATDSAVVEWQREYDPETAYENLAGFVPDLPRLAGQLPEDSELPSVELTETALYTIDTGTGQVRAVTYEKLVGIGDQKLIERRILTQQPIP